MSALRFILGDQLSRSISSLRDLDRGKDVVLMVEVRDETEYVQHHKQKIALVLSAMRHFAEKLRDDGVEVDYVKLDHVKNKGSFFGELKRAVRRHGSDRVVVTEPGEWRVWKMMQGWESDLGIEVEIREDERFLCGRSEFAEWAEGRKSLRMEYFYREMRKKTGWLMNGDQPAGGKWNYDVENRKSLPKNIDFPARNGFEPDDVTQAVLDLVEDKFGDHFGDLDNFRWAVDRDGALEALDFFIESCLPNFGDYQDAMKAGETFVFHSVISPYLNIGLLEPREVCEAAVEAYEKEEAPLSGVEGFVRQILGWREFIRGLYWLKMPKYAEGNFLNARRKLPRFYWTGDTDMRCLREAIDSTRRYSYAHHIQRLMITGNFALLARVKPKEVEEWYLIVYADAFEWVELPNTHGMALHADGGILGSKPYAASGTYINRMSDYCSDCVFNPREKLGEKACPFNYLYWNFLMETEKRLKGNPRMTMPYRNLDRMDKKRKRQIANQAKTFLDSLRKS